MQESIDEIIEKVNFKKKEQFAALLKTCIHKSDDSTKSTYAVHDNVIFKMNKYFAGFSPFNYEFGRDKKYEAGVEGLYQVCTGLGVEIEKEECFILFHIKDIGKFRKKETDLLKELKGLWKQYPEYALEDIEFSYAIKNLMRMKFINYRRGNMTLNQSIIIRYRTRK